MRTDVAGERLLHTVADKTSHCGKRSLPLESARSEHLHCVQFSQILETFVHQLVRSVFVGSQESVDNYDRPHLHIVNLVAGESRIGVVPFLPTLTIRTIQRLFWRQPIQNGSRHQKLDLSVAIDHA